MVLTAYLLDKDLYNGKMLDMLKTEEKLTSRVNSLPNTYSFSKQDFLRDEVEMRKIIFGTSEYTQFRWVFGKLGVVIFVRNKVKNYVVTGYSNIFLMKLWAKRTSIKTEKLFGLSIYKRRTDSVK